MRLNLQEFWQEISFLYEKSCRLFWKYKLIWKPREIFSSRREYSQTSLKMYIGVRIKIYSSVLEISEDSPPLITIFRDVIQNYNYSQWHSDFNWFKIFLFSIWKQVQTLIAKGCPKKGEYWKESSHKEKYLYICKCE